jgi:hypothetical protein
VQHVLADQVIHEMSVLACGAFVVILLPFSPFARHMHEGSRVGAIQDVSGLRYGRADQIGAHRFTGIGASTSRITVHQQGPVVNFPSTVPSFCQILLPRFEVIWPRSLTVSITRGSCELSA